MVARTESSWNCESRRHLERQGLTNRANREREPFHYRPRPAPHWAVASSLIGRWTPALAGPQIILYCRVSGRSQRPHLDDQERLLRDAVGTSGTIIRVFTDVGSGTDYDRRGLLAAISLARRTGAIILAEDRTRIIRGCFYTPRNQDERLMETELRHLEDILGGVKVYALLHPDASESEARSSQTIRGLSNGTTRRRVRRNRDHANARLYQQNYRMRPHVLQARFIRLLARRGLSNVHTQHSPNEHVEVAHGVDDVV